MTAPRSLRVLSIARRDCLAGPSRLPAITRPILLEVHQIRSISTTSVTQSGHNRWSKIRHRKGAADAARSTRISQLCNEIYRAIRPPASLDPSVNHRLAIALERGKEGGVTKANVENVMAKARSVADGTGKELLYEAIGPEGREALMIQCVSDNSNRTLQSLNKILQRFKFRIAPVAFMFDKKGLITIDPSKSNKTFDELFDVAVEAGAEDVQEVEGEEGTEWTVYTDQSDLSNVVSQLSSAPLDKDLPIISSELAYIPSDPIDVSDDGMGISEEQAEIIVQVSEALEDDSDVVKVWSNLA